jgi:hypothetical protein
MKGLTSKQLRIVGHEVQGLFGRRGLLPVKSMEDLNVSDPLLREISLPDNHMFLLTDAGLANLRRIVNLLDENDTFEGLAEYADIWSACRQVIVESLSKRLMPEDGHEMLQFIHEHLLPAIAEQTFVVEIVGVEFQGIDDCSLGAFTIVRPSKEAIVAFDIDLDSENLDTFVEDSKHGYWLVGSVAGTPRAAIAKFKAFADLATGMLAVVAASLYERGAQAFRFGIVMTPEEGFARARYLSWSNARRSISLTYKSAGSQRLALDARMRSILKESVVCKTAFSIFQSQECTELEEAIRKAIYWFSDAHRDQVMVMRLLKYWSCIETLFSAPNEVVQSASWGLADILVFGPVGFLDVKEHPMVLRRIVALYKKRSRATHRASHRHVTDADAAELSQWTAWMIYNSLLLAQQGIATLYALRQWLHTRRNQAAAPKALDNNQPTT